MAWTFQRQEMMMGAHLVDGLFQSDKYPTCPAGKVPLSCNDRSAQDLLYEYAQRRRAVDAEFSADLEEALRLKGFVPSPKEDDQEHARRLAERFAGKMGEAWFADGIERAVFTAMQRARRDERLAYEERYGDALAKVEASLAELVPRLGEKNEQVRILAAEVERLRAVAAGVKE